MIQCWNVYDITKTVVNVVKVIKKLSRNGERFNFLPSSCRLEECALRFASTISVFLNEWKIIREKEKKNRLSIGEYIFIWNGE